MKEPIAIVGGTGKLGRALAQRWAAVGTEVIIGSRSTERAENVAATVAVAAPAGVTSGMLNPDAARAAEIVFITVPFSAQSENLAELSEALRPGQVLVDCTVPLAVAAGGKPTRSLGVWQGSAAQQAQEMVPAGVEVVAAFHTVGAPALVNPDKPMSEDVLICGDVREHKSRVARLIELIPGLRAVDAGPLEMARIVEQLTPMLISINRHYKVHAGIKLTGLPERDLWSTAEAV